MGKSWKGKAQHGEKEKEVKSRRKKRRRKRRLRMVKGRRRRRESLVNSIPAGDGKIANLFFSVYVSMAMG